MNSTSGSSSESDDNDDDDDDSLAAVGGYKVIDKPEQSDDVLRALIQTADTCGITYHGPKGKAKEVTRDPVPSMAFDCPTSSAVGFAMAPTSGDHVMGDEAVSEFAPPLMVSVHCPGLGHGYGEGYGHAILRARKSQGAENNPLTALYFYDLVRSSGDLLAEFVNDIVDKMTPEKIRLGTASRPVFMDDKLFRHPTTGFRPLGSLDGLNPCNLLMPVLESEEKRGLLALNRHETTLDLYVLYIWSEVSLIPDEWQARSDIV